MSATASCEVVLPPAPTQPIAQAKRIVTVVGSLADGSQDVQVASTSPIVFSAAMDPNTSVTVQVAEVLANGQRSAPCQIQFVPYSLIQAVSADPAGFQVKVTAIADAADAVGTPTGDQSAPPDPSSAVAPSAQAAGDAVGAATSATQTAPSGRTVPKL